MSMNPNQGKRPWVKLWTNEWLDGTTRYQMSDAQRAFWIDLLAMAGRSRFPGTVCAGRDGDRLVGYPLYRFASLMAGPQQIDIEGTLALFESTGKVKVTVTSEGPPKLFAIELLNWKKYQSDLDAQAERARNYRSRKKAASRERHARVTQRHAAEAEEESEIEREEEEKQRRNVTAAPSAAIITQAFHDLGHKPFGPKRFQEIWGEEWSAAGSNANWTDIMEQTIQRAKSLKVQVPGLFYRHKHAIEKGEVQMRYKVTPL
jgi:hypothetical protein